MFKKIVALALLSASCSLPVSAQSFDSTAATGSSGNTSMGDPGDLGGWSAPTGNQQLNLPPTTTKSIALMQQGKSTLPTTRLAPVVEVGNEAVFGDEGILRPPVDGFTPNHYLENAFKNSPDLGTGHRIYFPSANGYPN